MAESGIDNAASAFHADMSPTQQQPRNERGQFATPQPVERLFESRSVEDDEGDLGGDDATGASRRDRPNKGENNGKGLRQPEGDDGKPDPDEGDEGSEEGAAEEEQSDDEVDGDAGEEGEHYEVTVDGEQKQVSLKEALEGYIRTETFHQRMNKVTEAANLVSQENAKNQQIRESWIKRHSDLEKDFEGLIPKEPDWDAEFARDPAGAHALKKQFDAVKSKLDSMRADRAKVEQEREQERIRQINDFAAQGRAKFIADNKIPDDDTLQKEIASMRKTALAQGFSEKEIAEVYDPRMLTILRKASKYDRMMAAKPKAVIPGKGKTLAPGNGVSRNSSRQSIDAAQKRLASSGRLDDATDFFRNILR